MKTHVSNPRPAYRKIQQVQDGDLDSFVALLEKLMQGKNLDGTVTLQKSGRITVTGEIALGYELLAKFHKTDITTAFSSAMRQYTAKLVQKMTEANAKKGKA